MSARARPAALPVLLVVLLVALLASNGCALLATNDDGAGDRLCTPGSYVFCRCPDRSEGTKLCRSDGQSFEPCSTGSGACGEIVASPPSPAPDAAGEPPSPLRAAADPAAGCSGGELPVPLAETVRIAGDTSTATADRHGEATACAGGAGAGDHVYRVVPAASGALSVTVDGVGALRPLVYLRSRCEDAASEIACAAVDPAGGARASLTTMVAAGRPYFLYIDGEDGTAGRYDGTLAITKASFCGDGRLDPAEACDDANAADGDGCAADCRSIDGDPASAGGCPGQPVDLWPGFVVAGRASTAGYGSVWDLPSDRCGSAGEHVYAVTAHATGTVNVRVEPTSGTATVVVAAACSGPPATMACRTGTTAVTEVPVLAERTVWIAVRGAGAYTIAFAVVAEGGL